MSVRKLKESEFEQVRKIQVHEDQLKFVGTVADVIAQGLDTWHLHVILDVETTVGFFNIDVNYSQNFPFTKSNELGLRAFLIGATYQGRGYCKAAIKALSSYLNETYSQHTSIALTVNCKNSGAKKCYLSGGFEDTGELFHGGEAGPQHIMRMPIAGDF